MKNTLTFSALLLVTVITIVTACKKDDVKQPTAHEKNIVLITDRNWKIVFNGFDHNKDSILDYDYHSGNENSMADCMADDEWEFRTDSTFYMRMLGEKNGCGDSDGGPFTWDLSKDSKTFNYAGEHWKVVILNDSVFRFSRTVNGEAAYTEFKR